MNLEKCIIVTLGTCGISAGAQKISERLLKHKDINLKTTGCIGLCAFEPSIFVELLDKTIVLNNLTNSEADIKDLLELYSTGIIPQGLSSRILYNGETKALDAVLFKGQKRVALRNIGKIDPFNIDDYIERGGYKLSISPNDIIPTIKSSGLRGRGGAGFPTWKKWQMLAEKNAEQKFIICNGDEGDPGAFMDRSILEGDPHSVLEGMQIGALATGATNCFIYLRAEYPLAVKTLEHAIAEAGKRGFLQVPVELRQGAGAFVCGEETALIASIEGKRGTPRFRPPYPVESGLWGKPTIINNVETLASIPWICNNPNEYQKLGYAQSKGTKVFALAGKLKKAGLVEIPFGMTLNELIFEVAGGLTGTGRFKAVQLGGPSGGCLPQSKLDTKIDYEELKEQGVIVGSGGLVVMDDSSCMVDIAKFFLTFTANESCGKCTFCRVGTIKLLSILENISKGLAGIDELNKLHELADAVTKLSLCGLGQTAPNPVLTTLKYFKEEYIEHIEQKKCRALVCKDLIEYRVDEEKCVACGACQKVCPVEAVTKADNTKKYVIDNTKCIKCGQCFKSCKFNSIIRE